MVRVRVLRHLVTLSVCGLMFGLLSGCGGGTPEYEGVDQQSTANQAQARTAAYGNASNPAASKKTATKAGLTGEAAARGRGGR